MFHTEFGEELEGGSHASLGVLQAVGAVVPGSGDGGASERVQSGAAERVPVADGEAQPVLHAASEHLLAGVVVSEHQWLVGSSVRPVRDLLYICGGGGWMTVSV